jgi:hypothetical protein
MATLMSAIEPGQHVPKTLAKPLEKLRIPCAIPVYQYWCRVDVSNHEALFQETGHHDDWNHVEAWTVGGLVPMYQKFTTKVLGDASPMALQGHDTGPLVPHISLALPTNMLTPMHMLTSSCKWPISARRRLHRDRSLCAFAWIFAPYIHCTSKPQDQEEEGAEPAIPGGLAAKAKSKASAGAKAMRGEGVGISMIPTGGKTVLLPLSILDIVLGALDLAISKAFDKVFDKIYIVRGRDAKRHIRPFTKGAARKAGWSDATRYTRDTLVDAAWKDAAKSFLLEFEVGVPFKLASVDFVAGKLKIWTYEFGSYIPSPPPPELRPLELLPEPEPRAPLGPYEPGRTILDEFFEGAPHAW